MFGFAFAIAALGPALQPVAFNPVGQIVGTMNEVEPVRDLMLRMVEEYLESVERLQGLQPDV